MITDAEAMEYANIKIDISEKINLNKVKMQ